MIFSDYITKRQELRNFEQEFEMLIDEKCKGFVQNFFKERKVMPTNFQILGEDTYRRMISSLSIKMTKSQFMVLDFLMKNVPFGSIMTYKECGEFLGKRNYHRVTSFACSSNPLPIVIPCHRIVPSNYQTSGYGNYVMGEKEKLRLIEMEKGMKFI